MAKLDIKDLRFLVLEGGGARGAAYLGAIQALEELLETGVGTTTELAMKPDGSGPIDRKSAGKNALLDYISCSDEQLKIRGVAGSSAGAITSYALALGLNAEVIEKQVMKFQFSDFLSEDQELPGKYRMVDKDGNLAIGEDDVKRDTNNKKRKEVVGAKSEQFVFKLDEDETKVRPNTWKLVKRRTVITLIVKAVLDGAFTNIERITIYFRKFFRDSIQVSNFNRTVNTIMQDTTTASIAAHYPTLINGIFSHSPIKISHDSIGNLLYDTGIYSGFKVREFFYNVTLLALTEDTHFRRSIIKAAAEGRLKPDYKDTLRPEDFASLKQSFDIVNRSKIKYDECLLPVLEYLQTMTFKQFFDLTGIHFAVCVSNLSTNLPLYFSHEWTPDFPIQEAVGASMTIPPAIKPIYNISNVVKTSANKRIRVRIKEIGPLRIYDYDFADATGEPSTGDYYRFLHVVKSFLQNELASKEGWISTNNKLDLETFLPKLREYAVGTYNAEKKAFDKKADTYFSVTTDGYEYTFGVDLLTFYYNSAYYGMFVDGGYRNNIPYNIFRSKNEDGTSAKLNAIFALKLDSSFPDALMGRLFERLQGFGSLEENIRLALKKEPRELTVPAPLQAIVTDFLKVYDELFSEEVHSTVLDRALSHRRRRFIESAKQILIDYYRNVEGIPESVFKDLQKKDNRAMRSLMRAMWKDYKGRKGIYRKPWEMRKGISVTAAEGYAYGSELGQLKHFSDHNYILPLYDCGLGTYDFDLDKVRVLKELAGVVSRNAVMAYFKK